MLQHIRKGHLVWRCRHCWQEMPDFNATQSLTLSYTVSLERKIKELALT
ncbi:MULTISPECIES: hypothetical protein [Planktothrix]|nr:MULTISPECIES: hypothetical protein [Planktothrix]CAD5913808.1 hypothetical protein NO758_00212 [Planktothrix agardhii]